MAEQIIIITDEPGWHGAQLKKAFAARGYASRYLALQDCGFDLIEGAAGLRLPGFGYGLPRGVFVRGVPGGSLEEVVFHLDILHALREYGVPVYNDARAIERSVDKAMTSFLLHRANLPTPPTWISRDPGAARARLQREFAAGHEVVFKPVFGAQGEGLLRLSRIDDLPTLEACNGVYYLQRFIDTGEGDWHDWRVFVVGGRAVAAMRRSGISWISNVARGGRCQPAVLDDPMRRLAEDAVCALDMHYAGVDVLRDKDGRLWVVEVNGVPAWRGLQGACNVPIADWLADDFLSFRKQPRAMEAVD